MDLVIARYYICSDMTVTGTIFDIKKFAIHDGPGIRTTVFFKGCPLDCWWCHNPEGKKFEPEKIKSARHRRNEIIGYKADVETVMMEIEKDVVFYDQSGGGVTFSGGEPMMQVDFLESLLEACRQQNIHTAVDTSGHADFDDFERIYNLVDIYLYDFKLMDDVAHIKYTGVTNKLIIENLVKLCEMGNKVIPRIPLVPGITDTPENLRAIIDYLSGIKNINQVSLLPYNKLGEDKFERFKMSNKVGQLQIQTKIDLEEISNLFKTAGFEVKIGG